MAEPPGLQKLADEIVEFEETKMGFKQIYGIPFMDFI
jgi:hypothetical protein